MRMIDVVRFIVGFVVLSIGAYTDFKTRMASNCLWLVLGSVALSLLLVDFYLYGLDVFKIVSLVVMVLLFYVLFQLRVIVGGADVKALMCVCILIPLFILDVFFLSVVVMLLSVPVVCVFKKMPLRDVLFGYPYPFLVSLLCGFVLSYVLSGFWSMGLLASVSQTVLHQRCCIYGGGVIFS